jgi:(p)ppGpp synthase/HD superfamily hydrolase
MSQIIIPMSRFSPRRRPIRGLEIINYAYTMSVLAHTGQTRKDGVTPQILHPLAVQRLLAACGVADPVVHAGALLHDSLEDNPGTWGQTLLDEMERSMPMIVVDTVLALTDPIGLSTEDRKALQLRRFASAPWEVRVIKLADVVASLQEGPAPSWNSIRKQSYLQQRRQLVYESLGKPCGRLLVMFERALRLPTWQSVQ